jgi:hypothetical protein
LFGTTRTVHLGECADAGECKAKISGECADAGECNAIDRKSIHGGKAKTD